MRWLAGSIFLAACATKPSTETNDTVNADDTDVASTGPFWYGDVEPAIARVCWRCHGPGGVGKVDFTNYNTAKALSAVMASYVETGYMPPAAADPDCRSYLGDERSRLTADEKTALRAWADAGAPEGDPSLASPPYTREGLPDADTVLTLPEPHVVKAGPDGNEYACYEVDNPFTDTVYVTGFDVDVDNADVVHHLLLFKVPDGDVGEAYGVTDTKAGFDCSNPIMASNWQPLHAWAPGGPPVAFDGLGIQVNPTDKLVIQMHYFDRSDSGQIDQSSYLLRTERFAQQMVMYPAGPDGFVIPAGDDAWTDEATFTNDFSLNVAVNAIFPHQHLLGTGYHAWLEHADGTEECLVQSDRWDFHNQATYQFRDTPVFASGDTVHMECTWDNSTDNPNQIHDPPQPIGWGENTDAEMCYFLSYLSLAP
jgi:hypothetical protein